jgi:gliding motility-associated-like protein
LEQLKIVLIFTIFLIKCSAIAQGESNVWYFGQYAGLDFNTSPPSPLTNGAMNTQEGCASICDKNGELLFYTNGEKIWNKNHTLMPNGTGLFGHYSSVQSAVIIPYPGTYNNIAKRFNKYIVVTVDEVYNDYFVPGPQHGVCYSEVDMSLDGGLGDITVNKNIYLFDTTTTEKICAVQHSNNCDFWVIGKSSNNVDYYSYAITSTGVNSIPVISSPGPNMGNYIGSLKASPNGKIVAATHGGNPAGAPGGPAGGIPANDNGIFVYDFDNSTGVLTFKFFDKDVSGNSFTYPFPSSSYSQEFSPDSKILYHSVNNNPDIFQYDLTVASQMNFIGSRQVIGTTSNNGYYAKVATLQRAPDGKIYAALRFQSSLGVINNPNILGIGCNYVDMQQGLGGKICDLGLPNFVTNLIRPLNKIIMSNNCPANQIQFGLLDTVKIINYNWAFANLLTPNIIIGTSTVFNPIMQVQLAGNYIISCVANYGCYTDTLIDTLDILEPIAKYNFTSGCIGAPATFTDNSSIPNGSITSHIWDFGDGSPISTAQHPNHTYTSTGIYYTKLIVTTNTGCVDSVVWPIVINPNPIPNFTVNDTVGCELFCISLQNTSTITTGINTSLVWTLGDGTNSVSASFDHCYTNDSIYTPILYSITLEVTSDSGCAALLTKENYITVYPRPVAAFTVDPTTTNIKNPLINIQEYSIGGNVWNWNFDDNNVSTEQDPHTHIYSDTGNYTIQLIVSTDYNCKDTAYNTITIEPDFLFYVPNIFSPNNDGINDSFTGNGVAIKNFHMLIFNRWGEKLYETTSIAEGWNGFYKGKVCEQGVYVYKISFVDEIKNKFHQNTGSVNLLR